MLADIATKFVRTLPAEAAHMATIRALKAGLGTPARRPIFSGLTTRLPNSGLTFDNPIGLAAGFDKNAEVFGPMLKFGFGFVECGTVTPRPQPGNDRPRLFRLSEDAAVINRMGFNNEGLSAYARRLKMGGAAGRPVGANVGANKVSVDAGPDAVAADYEAGLNQVWPLAQYITINISSPNTPGLRGLQGKQALEDLLTRCGQRAGALALESGEKRPVFLKVAPDLDAAAIDDIIEVSLGAGDWLAGLIISNTTLARPDTLKSADKGEAGGLSGAPLMAPSTEILRIFARQLKGKKDLIGVGGIASGADAYAKIRAGAQAVQLYSALVFQGPGLVARINRELSAALKADGFDSVTAAVGADL